MHLDKYLSSRTNLNFSHGICDICIEEHFPDVLQAWRAEDQAKVKEESTHSK
jgi:hypothetical protein